jgi:hypothetical protein
VSALVFAYSAVDHAMTRESLSDAAVNGRVDELVARGLHVSVVWLTDDPVPTADELLAGFEEVL